MMTKEFMQKVMNFLLKMKGPKQQDNQISVMTMKKFFPTKEKKEFVNVW